MRLEIKGVAELRERLASIRADEVMARALAEQAEHLAQAVRGELATAPGAGGYDRPWAQTGALRDSIGAQADGLHAVVGSSDPAAAPQETGTATIPPRPFLAPVAAQRGEEIARAIGGAVAAALGGESQSPESASTVTPTTGLGAPHYE